MSFWWLRVKAFALKVCEFLKNHAALALLFVGFVFAVVLAKNKQGTIELLVGERQRLSEMHKRQLENIQTTVDREVARRRLVEQQYNDLMAKIKSEHDAGVQRIAEQHRVELREAIVRNQDDPGKMASAINNIFGLPVVEIRPVNTP